MTSNNEKQNEEPKIESKEEKTSEEVINNQEDNSMKKKLKEMEEDQAKMEKMQEQVEASLKPPVEGPDIDKRSVYVGNVDYSCNPEDLQEFFKTCGTVNRVTILCDKHSGHPKGFAYVEFGDPESVDNALLLQDAELKGRQIKVSLKRTNVPTHMRGRGRGRGRGFPGTVMGRGGYGFSPYPMMYGYSPPPSSLGYRPRFKHRRASFRPSGN